METNNGSNSGMRGMKNRYTVTKTIRFELKPVYKEKGYPDINFEKTHEWLENKHFYSVEETEQAETKCKEEPAAGKKERRNAKLKETANESFKYFEKVKDVFNKLLKKSIPHFAVLVKAALLENLDSRLYHKEKKSFNKSVFIPLTNIEINNYDWFYEGLEKRLQKITEQKIHITTHSLWAQDPTKTMMNNADWYKDIEGFANALEAFIALYSYIDIRSADKLNNCDDECKKQVETIKEQLTSILKDSDAIEEEKRRCSKLKELIKEHTFTECGLTSLNSKALNKDPEKRGEEKNWLEKEEEKLKKTESKIDKLDGERKQVLDGDKKTEKKGLYELIREESKKWSKKDDEYALHLLDEAEYNQKLLELGEKKKELKEQVEKLETERDKLKKLKDKKLGEEIGKKSKEIDEKKKEITKIKDEIVERKIKKRMIQDRKRIFLEKGILPGELKNGKSKDKFVEKIREIIKDKNDQKKDKKGQKKDKKGQKKPLNFSYIWDCKEGYQKLECIASTELQKLHKENKELIEKKKRLSQERGQSKMLIHSLKREIERQNKIDHFALLIKNSHFFYLALICRKERGKIMKQIQQTAGSEYMYLDYKRLTMKALEKIVFHEKMAFDDPEAKEWARKYSEYKNPKNSNKKEFIKLFTDKIKCLEWYNFPPEDCYETIEDFAHDVNTRLYTVKWQSINEDKLFELEKKGKIKIFKIHNKDFSWAKRKTYAENNSKKNNLFTSYWLDLMDNIEKNKSSSIRILPEIDLYKKRKEWDMSESQPVKDSLGKELKGTVKGRRFRENKFYAAFRLEFYPEKEAQEQVAFNNSLLERTKRERTYFLGLDRGENELITYCLIDEEDKIVKKNTGEPIIGDWNKDNEKLNGESFNYACKLKKFTDKKKELLFLIEQKRYKENGELEEKIEQLEKDIEQDKILEVRSVKKGFCGHVLEQINEIICHYKNVYIVMEDLDKEQKNSNKSNKEKNLEKTLGASAYQAIEDAIVSKFKYFRTKDNQFMGSQIVPNIERIVDLRITQEEDNKYGEKKRSKEQIGNVLFVNEFYTSQICPECGFCVCNEGEEADLKTQSIAEPLIIKDATSCKEVNNNPLTIKIDNTNYIINHAKYLKNENKNDTNTIEFKNLKKILKPRLKNNDQVDKKKFKKKFKSKDPFYCSKCGKNTEDKKFSQGFESGDDIAAYNIARLGLDYYKEKQIELTQ